MSETPITALLAEARRLEGERTQGPWEWEAHNRVVCNRDGEIFYDDSCGEKVNPESDAAFIAFWGTHAPAILAYVGELEREREEFWREVALGHDIEPREFFETEAPQQGWSSPIAMALHHIWKRDAKVESLIADRDRLAGEVAQIQTLMAEVERLKVGSAEDYDASIAQLQHSERRAERAEAEVTRLTAQWESLKAFLSDASGLAVNAVKLEAQR